MGKENKNSYIRSKYLTEKDIYKVLLQVKSNYHHYLWIALLYTGGLTIQELLEIKTKDINIKNFSNMKIHSLFFYLFLPLTKKLKGL